MFSKWSWLRQVVCSLLSIYSFGVSDVLQEPCGYITPESPVVSLESSFTAYCILRDYCSAFGYLRADKVIWRIHTEVVPKKHYSIINGTVSSVTFNDTSILASPLTCNVLITGNIEQTIYGIQVALGLSPDKPENLSCIVHQHKGKKNYSQTCTWEPGRYTFLDTNYTLKSRWPIKQFADCLGANNSCTSTKVVFFVNLEVWVEAKNALGVAESDRIVFDPIKQVKPLPPCNLSLNSGEFPRVLKLSWESLFDEVPLVLRFEIRYKIIDSINWIQVLLEDTETQRDSFFIQELRPNTKYVVQLRCVTSWGGHWSDWSKEAVGFTAEDRPSKGPDLWRKISPVHSPENWTLVLIWKELNPSDANGIILKYDVSILGKPPLHFQQQFYSLNTTQLTLNVENGTYEVRIKASNSVGESPASVLLIPATNSRAPVKNLTAFPKDGKLWVEWTVPKPDVNRYIIEWYEECDNLTCATDWQLESGTKNCTFLRGGIKPRKSYKISVYPLYSNGQGEERSIQAYLQEDAPAIGPTVRTAKVGKTDALIEWEPLSVEEQNGFIKYYNIIYKTATGNETVVFVDPSKTEYPLSSLSSDTLYMVQVAAYTKNGGKRGPAFTFTTKKFAEGEIEAIVVPVCLAILLFTLLSVLFCFNKRDSIKKHIWPNVPDPSKSVIAQWSPQTPSKHFHHSKDQMYPEGSFTDVSVVEIDKKSFSEQDPKPFYLLRKEKNASEGHSSGIGGSSCMSSPRQSVSDSDEGEPAQNTSSTVQYSTVVPNGYRDQIPSVQVFSRSESTQPLLDSEERPEDPPVLGSDNSTPRHRYFKQNCNNDDTVMDEPHLDGVKQISPINEEDAAGLQTLQMCSSGPDEHDVALAGAFHPSPEGLAAEFETLRTNAVTEDEVPKCYLPQTVKQGGYMPQ
ncbi:interleukin-6 receptor subunit beta isoform X1 [Zootoca vivipara]|uniref:interleukin-6 receptor subunit beta isoform X1 n=1 Tax=Zootoca vivipara TaxID=8524 RepID=UPI00293BD1E7|nr:interleukin-6 receptor subunit beta isoform X1 [Zootoca vivipara]